jgi:serine/threonine protein kinase
MKQSNGDSSKEPLTEKIDIYGLGGVFFKIITGLDPWLEYFNQYNQTYAESRVEEAKRRGEIPHFPVTLLSRKKKAALRPIYDSMVQCLQLNPQDRPTAKELYAYLQSEVEAYMEEARRKKEEKGNNATDNAIIMNTEINTNVSISESLSESLKD